MTAARVNKGLHRAAAALACATVVLLVAGALVTSNEAGDSVPDWPLSFGRWLIGSDQFKANVRFEFSHRVIAGAVGFLTAGFTAAVWLSKSASKRLRMLSSIALCGVILQAMIGGLRVLFPAHKAEIAVPHALIAQSFFVLVVAIAIVTSRSWNTATQSRTDVEGIGLAKLSATTVGAVLVQLVLGAGFRHGAFGITPHVAGAVVVTILIAVTTARTLRDHGDYAYLRKPALLAFGLLIAQIMLGISAYVARVRSTAEAQPLEPMVSLTVAHVVVGALTLAAVLTLAMRSNQILASRSEQFELRSRALAE